MPVNKREMDWPDPPLGGDSTSHMTIGDPFSSEGFQFTTTNSNGHFFYDRSSNWSGLTIASNNVPIVPVLQFEYATSLECPVHGTVEIPTLNFNFPELNIDETYCIICVRDALRKILTPLNEGGGEIPPPPKELGVSISRYDIATNNKET